MGNKLTHGLAVVITPEPSALEGLLLGTGLIGLAELTRRKLKLGTLGRESSYSRKARPQAQE